jgi:hypothetical protein
MSAHKRSKVNQIDEDLNNRQCISNVCMIPGLPSWLEHSALVKQFQMDYQSKETFPLVDPLRIFEYPNEINENNVALVLDNIRFFGISDVNVLKPVFSYFVAITTKPSEVESMKNEFPELKQLWRNIEHTLNTDMTDFSCDIAATKNLLLCLHHAHENGCYWDVKTCSNAAANGNLNCLKYAHENGCPWNERVSSNAAANGNLNCLKYAHENGCPWNEETCTMAVWRNHLNCLKYAHENGCPWNEETCSNAAHNGHLVCLKYAHENGCPWNEETCSNAARGGHLNCLKYAHENGCPWNQTTCSKAVQARQEDCLKYAHENGCPCSHH